MNDIFDQLADLCLPLIKHFHDDLLKHDRNTLNKYPGVPFLHWTRECGTDLTMLHPHDSPAWPAEGVVVPYIFGTANREHILGQNKGMGKYHNALNPYTTHYYNGKTLRPITTALAEEIIEDYARSVAYQWRKITDARNKRGITSLPLPPFGPSYLDHIN